jgi:hypothetical protein
LAERLILVRDSGLVERGLHVEDRLFGRFENRVEATKDGHRQDDVAVLPANIQVAEDIVRNAPDEVGDPVQLALFHVPDLPHYFGPAGIGGSSPTVSATLRHDVIKSATSRSSTSRAPSYSVRFRIS